MSYRVESEKTIRLGIMDNHFHVSKTFSGRWHKVCKKYIENKKAKTNENKIRHKRILVPLEAPKRKTHILNDFLHV